MYGLVDKAVEALVTSGLGEETGEVVKVKAGFEEEVFLSNQSYPDEATFNLVAAATEVPELPISEILISFGEHWFLKTAEESYGPMMVAAGASLREFLVSLPHLHTRVSMIYPDLKPTGFECRDVAENSLKLRYHTHRSGLTNCVVGLVQGLGKYDDTFAVCELEDTKDENGECDVFEVRWADVS